MYLLENIKRIAVIDDKPEARESMSDLVAEANYEPLIVEKSFNSVIELFNNIKNDCQAAIFDHNLKVGNYAAFFGAQAVSALYLNHFPSILVTTYSKSDIDNIRPFRRNIPVLYSGDEIDIPLIPEGLKRCINEFNDNFSSDRKPWRVILRVEDIDLVSNYFFVIIPSWNPNESIRIPLKMLGTYEKIVKKGTRFFANINLGAESQDDIYFENFQICKEPPEEFYASLSHS